jgi:hypothetical protein
MCHPGKSGFRWAYPDFKVQVRIEGVSTAANSSDGLPADHFIPRKEFNRLFHMCVQQVERTAFRIAGYGKPRRAGQCGTQLQCRSRSGNLELRSIGDRQAIYRSLYQECIPIGKSTDDHTRHLTRKYGMHRQPFQGDQITRPPFGEVYPLMRVVRTGRRRVEWVDHRPGKL